MQTNVVLPPIGPLFANATGNTSHTHFSARQAVTTAAAAAGSANQSPPPPGSETPQHAALTLLLCEKSLRTPTSGHAHAYANGTFPSSSPIKKDSLSSITTPSLLTTPKTSALTSATSSTDKMSHHPSASMLLLSLDSPKASSSSSPLSHDDGSASPTCEDEKLRLSRERNRLHAQRTRIRKRELLESLKERIHALQSEHGLLKQAFEFHATAVCLLSLGANGACDDPSIKRLEEVSDAALELFNTTSTTLHACVDDDDEDLLLLDESSEASGASAPVVHDKSCEWYDDDDEHEHADSASCTCRSALESQQSHDQTLNNNGKRVHPASTALSFVGSKEEREQLRRERNRLHARRARLRKKLVLERSQQAVQELRKRNEYLRERLAVLITSIYGASAATLATKPELSSLS